MSETLRLKVGSKFQTFSLGALYWDWVYNRWQAFTFSSGQQTRIHQWFAEHSATLESLRNTNYDVYTDEDF